jgi:hypothetical protein
MPEIVTTPISYFEVEMEYSTPDIKMWLDRVNVVQAVYAALKPWDITVDDVEILTTGKPSEQGIKFKIPKKLSTFFFGPAYCKFTRDSTSWETAEETIQILDAAFQALVGETKAVVAKRKTVIVLHLQPKTLSFFQILAPFVPAKLAALEPEQAKTMAIIMKWEKRKMTLDGSGQIANGLFLRFEREFDGTASYEEMAIRLRSDENEIFAMLGVQEEA